MDESPAAGLTIGLHFSHEQHAPSTLLRHAKLAAQAGLTIGMCSDHLRPWSERQGHAGFAWAWLASALEATPLSFGTVCAPGQRYHPVIVAQMAATLAEMYDGRLWVALGSGEALNEAATGDRWPPKAERQARLEESVAVIRALLAGERVTTSGRVQAKDARLYVRPVRPPLLIGAALTEETARRHGRWADGLITVALPREELRRVVQAFREGGGEDKPLFLQVALSFAPTYPEAEAAAYHQWRQCVLSNREVTDLETPEDFDRLSDRAAVSEVVEKIRVSADIEQHIGWLEEDAALGFQRIYLHNLARGHQERFIDALATRVVPALSTR
jgi:coenzyme F420-dependent glucose-6-phosphate dehydrogenase